MEISAYMRKCLREDEEFILYRGRPGQGEVLEAPHVLLLTPALKRPALETLEKNDHEEDRIDDKTVFVIKRI